MGVKTNRTTFLRRTQSITLVCLGVCIPGLYVAFSSVMFAFKYQQGVIHPRLPSLSSEFVFTCMSQISTETVTSLG
jgi:hypothetical protein